MGFLLDRLFTEEPVVNLIRSRLPVLFRMAEIECSRAGKVGMEVGSVRESILISLLMCVYGEANVSLDVPITESEIDVLLYGYPISIKTKTGFGLNGIKAVWTVDPTKVREFIDHFEPHCDVLFAQLIWNKCGGLYYFPVEAQKVILNKVGIENFLSPPKEGTNPRGVEYRTTALESIRADPRSKSISILWKKPDIHYNKYERWIDLWMFKE